MMGRSNWGKNQGLSEGVKRTLGSDIIVPDDFHFSIECKHYKDTPNYSQIIKGPDAVLDHWLAECVYDAINLDLHPLLFFKTNRKGTYFALPRYFLPHLTASHILLYGAFVISGIDSFVSDAENIKRVASNTTLEENGSFYRAESVQLLLTLLEEK